MDAFESLSATLSSSTASLVIPEPDASLLSTSVLNFSQVMAWTVVNNQPKELHPACACAASAGSLLEP